MYQRIQKHLLSLRTVSFRHVRRQANKLENTLANQGVINSESIFEMKWQEMYQGRVKDLCEELGAKDREIFKHWARRKDTI